jgi:hypothetical protein
MFTFTFLRLAVQFLASASGAKNCTAKRNEIIGACAFESKSTRLRLVIFIQKSGRIFLCVKVSIDSSILITTTSYNKNIVVEIVIYGLIRLSKL